MKLKTNFFFTICQRKLDFPHMQVFIDPESFDEDGCEYSGLTHTLVEYLGMNGNTIAGIGKELDALVKMQGSNGLKLEETIKVHIFYVDSEHRRDLALSALNSTAKDQLYVYTFGD